MKKHLLLLSVVLLIQTVVVSVFAQQKPRAGDLISGIVTDSVSPLMAVYITEQDSADRVVAYAYTDLKGEFSFRLVNPKDRIQFSLYRKERIILPIDKAFFEIRMEDDKNLPPVSWDDFNDLDSREFQDLRNLRKEILDISITTTDPVFPNTIHISEESEMQHEYVDLGLSVKWATCNVGAESPEDYGDYFAWGETEPYYSSLSPLVWKEGHEEGYWGGNSYFDYDSSLRPPSYRKYRDDGNTVLAPEDDAAHVNWGGEWRMPTREEFQELLDKKNCTWTWTSICGIQGYKVESRKKGFKGNYIFLPGADSFSKTRWGSSYMGLYWSSTLYKSLAWCLDFASNDIVIYTHGRVYGLTIRPVCP